MFLRRFRLAGLNSNRISHVTKRAPLNLNVEDPNGWMWDEDKKMEYRGKRLKEIDTNASQSVPDINDKEKDMVTFIPISDMTTKEVNIPILNAIPVKETEGYTPPKDPLQSYIFKRVQNPCHGVSYLDKKRERFIVPDGSSECDEKASSTIKKVTP